MSFNNLMTSQHQSCTMLSFGVFRSRGWFFVCRVTAIAHIGCGCLFRCIFETFVLLLHHHSLWQFLITWDLLHMFTLLWHREMLTSSFSREILLMRPGRQVLIIHWICVLSTVVVNLIENLSCKGIVGFLTGLTDCFCVILFPKHWLQTWNFIRDHSWTALVDVFHCAIVVTQSC